MPDQMYPSQPDRKGETEKYRPTIGPAARHLGICNGDEQTPLMARDKIPPEIYEESILPQAVNILNACGDPRRSVRHTHLAIGYVQSGKTISMTTTMCLARDNGYKVIIVLAGNKTNLVDQTRGRLQDYLTDLVEEDSWLFESCGDKSKLFYSELPNTIETVLDENDYTEKTLILVVMKHHKHLRLLTDAFAHVPKNKLGTVLIIDDEADQVSLNNNPAEEEPSANHGHLLKLRDTLGSFAYLQYTATPQAPLLINVNTEFSPDSLTLLKPGPKYVGGKHFFPESQIPQVYQLADEGEVDQNVPPPSLGLAIRVFLLAAHQIKMEPRKGARPSMMVHPGQKIRDHNLYYKWVKDIVEHIKTTLNGPAEGSAEFFDACDSFSKAYQEIKKTDDQNRLRPINELCLSIRKSFSNLKIWSVNSDNTDVDFKQKRFNILVGGDKLNRGFTVEGLITTHMNRAPGQNADTLQQRARFFGYKKDDFWLCRLFLPRDIINRYERYVEHEEDLLKKLKPIQEIGGLKHWTRKLILDPTMRATRQTVLEDPIIRTRHAW